MLATVERVLLRNLESTISDETLEVRRREIEAAQGAAKRSVLRTSQSITEKHPRSVAKLLGVGYVPLRGTGSTEDIKYLAEGYESVVFRLRNQVIKVHKGTAFMSNEARLERASRKSREHEAMAAMLGQVVLPQETDIGSHPSISKLTVVRTRQEYCSGLTDPQLVGQSSSSPATAARLERFGRNHPIAFGQLPAFVEGGFALYDTHRLVPDTEGPGNLMIGADDNLVMIDGQPIGEEHSQVQDLIRWQLEDLSKNLELVAA